MTIKKDFYLAEKWDENTADALDSFCADLETEQVERRSGQFVGTGSTNEIRFERARGAPAILWLTNLADGSNTAITIPLPAGHVTSWTKETFTLRAGSSFNLSGKSYHFLLIAS